VVIGNTKGIIYIRYNISTGIQLTHKWKIGTISWNDKIATCIYAIFSMQMAFLYCSWLTNLSVLDVEGIGTV